MAYIIRDEETIHLSIFVILFQDENCFFVWKAPEQSLKRTYKYHYYCESSKTKKLFSKAKENGKIPPMFRLESLETTQEKAFLHCVAWAKYFMEKGFTSCCGDFVDKYTEKLRPESKAIYNSIKGKMLSEICPEGGDLFPDFGKVKQKNREPKNNAINFRVTPEEYFQIKAAAGNTSLNMTEYCRTMVLNGRVIEVSPEILTILSSYVDEFVTRDRLLKNILFTIHSTRSYYPPDLEIIEKAITENAEQQKIAFESVKEVLKQLLDQ